MKNLNVPMFLALALLVAGCSTTPRLDSRFGQATTALMAQQVRDPGAALSNDHRPVDGIEGQAASNAVDQYYKSFSKPAPPMTVLNLGVMPRY